MKIKLSKRQWTDIGLQAQWLHKLAIAPALGPKFSPGRIVATPGAKALFDEGAANPHELIRRYLNGDWGDLSKSDKNVNDQVLSDVEKAEGTEGEDPNDYKGRIMGSYQIDDKTKIWIITDPEWHTTTFLLPDEY